MSSRYLQRCQSGIVILCSECMHVVSFCCSLFHVCNSLQGCYFKCEFVFKNTECYDIESNMK